MSKGAKRRKHVLLTTLSIVATFLVIDLRAAADGAPFWHTLTPGSAAPNPNGPNACLEMPNATLESGVGRAGGPPLILVGSRAFACSCGARALVGGGEGAKLVGGVEGAKLVGGDEGANLVGAQEGAKLVGGGERAKLVGGGEGAKLIGGGEGAKLVGGGEGAKLVGGQEGAKLVGGEEGAKLVGAQTQLMCQIQPGCAGFRLLGLNEKQEVGVRADGRESRAPAACVAW